MKFPHQLPHLFWPYLGNPTEPAPRTPRGPALPPSATAPPSHLDALASLTLLRLPTQPPQRVPTLSAPVTHTPVSLESVSLLSRLSIPTTATLPMSTVVSGGGGVGAVAKAAKAAWPVIKQVGQRVTPGLNAISNAKLVYDTAQWLIANSRTDASNLTIPGRPAGGTYNPAAGRLTGNGRTRIL